MGKTPNERRFGQPFEGPIYSIWFIGWVSPCNYEGLVNFINLGRKSYLDCSLNTLCTWGNLEGWRTHCRRWGVGNDGRIGNLLEKTQCERGDTSPIRRIYFSNRRWTNQNSRRRSGTENIHLDTAATNSRRRSRWLSWRIRRVLFTTSWFISRCRWSDERLLVHVWKLHIPPSRWTQSQTLLAERSIIPYSIKIHWRNQNYTHTNLDVKQEKSIDDHWMSMDLETCQILGQVSHNLFYSMKKLLTDILGSGRDGPGGWGSPRQVSNRRRRTRKGPEPTCVQTPNPDQVAHAGEGWINILPWYRLVGVAIPPVSREGGRTGLDKNLPTDTFGPGGDWRENSRHPGQIIYGQSSGRNWKSTPSWRRGQKWSNESSILKTNKNHGRIYLWPEGLGIQRNCQERAYKVGNISCSCYVL